MNKRILILFSVLLIGTLAGLGGYFIIKNFIKPPITYDQTSASASGEQDFMGRGICRRLNFTPDQKETAQKMESDYRQKLSVQLSQLDSLRGVMIQTLIQDSENEPLLNKITASIGEHHVQMKQITIGHIQQLRSICTEEQSQKLNSMLEELLDYPQYGNKNQGHGQKNMKRRRHRRGRN
ncbi:MAG: hypothetical protein JEZ14_04250 [Marinilabiliaceae bacterium]|nr:hypothetical protein [Marinilabiliaceae bacterium]